MMEADVFPYSVQIFTPGLTRCERNGVDEWGAVYNQFGLTLYFSFYAKPSPLNGTVQWYFEPSGFNLREFMNVSGCSLDVAVALLQERVVDALRKYKEFERLEIKLDLSAVHRDMERHDAA
jgi:hypothetical protein